MFTYIQKYISIATLKYLFAHIANGFVCSYDSHHNGVHISDHARNGYYTQIQVIKMVMRVRHGSFTLQQLKADI